MPIFFMTDSDITLDIASAFGAHALGQRFAVYVPNKDANGHPVVQARWVDEGLRLLSSISGGASAMPPIQGAG